MTVERLEFNVGGLVRVLKLGMYLLENIQLVRFQLGTKVKPCLGMRVQLCLGLRVRLDG